jgi:hypothetical protein
MAISVFLSPSSSNLRVAKHVFAGLACSALGVGIAALFTALPEAILRWSDISGSFIFAAALAVEGIASHIDKKKKQTPQETPQ